MSKQQPSWITVVLAAALSYTVSLLAGPPSPSNPQIGSGVMLVSNASISAPWLECIASTDDTSVTGTGPEAADVGNNVTTILAANATRRSILRSQGEGTFLRLRMKYDDGVSAVTSPVVRVFGRSLSGQWEVLSNQSGNTTATLTVDTANDVADGTYMYTTPAFSGNTWDVAGCSEIVVTVTTAFNATGTETTSLIEYKLF